MKKRVKAAKDLTVGDTFKIAGLIWEVDDVAVIDDHVDVHLWCWGSPRKVVRLTFLDATFPVTIR